MNNADQDRDPLESLATEFAERLRRGERPTVDEFADRYPELADDIRDLFPTILAVESTKSTSAGGGAAELGAPRCPERLGDYRIVRELGRGGMGVVYEAEQQSLDRHVAIKVLPKQFFADRKRRERFEREARTAARLHHTNIVPIFGIGEHDGYHYYVMQYIHGVGLDAVFQVLSASTSGTNVDGPSSPGFGTQDNDLLAVARRLIDGGLNESNDSARTRPLVDTNVFGAARDASGGTTRRSFDGVDKPPHDDRHDPRRPQGASGFSTGHWRRLAQLLVPAADALAYAHDQGVLHRDMKPGNLLLDGDGKLWVTDFGLAKAFEQEEITEAGDVIGTLRYMAKEQFRGRADARSDVYALGITLYELITLSPAFAERERGRLIHAILHEPLVPPRTRVPAIPLDLETIILKATAREPADRYASAVALRDDLLRFADDLPILARRATWTERLRRWTRRNPALATTATLAAALLVATAAISTTAYFGLRAANRRVNSALAGAVRQRERAEATADLAVEALDTIFNEFAPDSAPASSELSVDGSQDDAIVVSVPQVLSAETASLLEHMLGFYRRLAQQDDESQGLKVKIAEAHRRVGQIYELLGNYAESKAAYTAAITAYERLRARAPNDASLVVGQGRAHNQLGGVLAAQDQMAEALEQFDTAMRILQPVVEGPSPSNQARFELARSCYLSARRAGLDVAVEPPRPGERPGEVPPRRPLNRLRPPRGGPDRPPPERPGPGRAPGPQWPGMARRPLLDRAIDLLSALADDSPDEPDYRHLLALCLRELGPPAGAPPVGRPTPGVDQALDILESLAEAFPKNPRIHFDLAQTHAMRDRGPDTAHHLHRAAEILNALVGEHPNVPRYRFALGNVYLRRSHWHGREGRTVDAVDDARRALRIQRALVDKFPDVVPFVLTAALYESALAHALEQRGELDEARSQLESATARLLGAGAMDEQRPHIRGLAARCFGQLSHVYERLNDQDKAGEARAKSRSLRRPPDRLNRR